MPIGTHGKIRFYPAGADGWTARTTFRDIDGITRPVERASSSKAAAERRLREALRDRVRSGGTGAVTGEHRFRDVAALWLAEIEAAVRAGTRSPSTAELYRRQLDKHVLPALGAFRLREIAVPTVDRFLVAVRDTAGVALARTCRSIVSGVLRLAVRHGAMPANPVRDTVRLEGRRGKSPRALTAAERAEWLAQLDADENAVRWDLPDLCRVMLATGVRIGEALAVSWPDVDLDAGALSIDHTIVRVAGVGLVRKATKTATGERTLLLPATTVAMLRRRLALAEDVTGPVFPDSVGGWRDPSNTRRMFRQARGGEAFAWVTTHVFRKTAATILDEAGLSARVIADQLGHSRPSLTQDVYMARKLPGRAAVDALDRAFPEG
jgi:integrase